MDFVGGRATACGSLCTIFQARRANYGRARRDFGLGGRGGTSGRTATAAVHHAIHVFLAPVDLSAKGATHIRLLLQRVGAILKADSSADKLREIECFRGEPGGKSMNLSVLLRFEVIQLKRNLSKTRVTAAQALTAISELFCSALMHTPCR